MEYIKGKFRSEIFSGDAGYKVGLFKVKESSEEINHIVNKTITFTGTFPELNTNDTYIFYGELIDHIRYGEQFRVDSYEKVKPEGKDAVVEFLTSSFIKGCGEKSALKIVNVLGDNAIQLIKDDKQNLLNVGLTANQTEKIYKSIMDYYDQDEIIKYLMELEFSVKDISKFLERFGKRIKNIILNDLYSLREYVEFEKLDRVFFKIYEETNDMRIKACIVETLIRLSEENGDTYSYKDEIYDYMYDNFKIDLYDIFDNYIEILENESKIVHINERYYLRDYYESEQEIAFRLKRMYKYESDMSDHFDEYIIDVQNNYFIKYNDEQIKAIRTALENQVTIITGGPGTGKTTIINGLIRMFQEVNHYSSKKMNDVLALLAPTGRASKRMSETTNYGASTIHRFLKWNKELNEFGINEYNQEEKELVIIDEVSMIDTLLLSNLLKGLDPRCKLVFVGDANQLPSVAAGNVLKDIIESEVFPHVELKNIYRQSDNSFIPILAREVKNANIESDINSKKDDFNFLICGRENIKNMLNQIVLRCVDKGLTEDDVQVLAPMYKGENGIDNLNKLLQNIFNPHSDRLEEVEIGSVVYRVNDKVINLVNNVDQNIFNGDIGYIKEINKKSKEFMKIDFYGNLVVLKREDMPQIKHAYAMSIHKSQGGEFNHVIIPVTMEFRRMLYNKLIYTGVSRAKKSLVLIGDPNSFLYSVTNNYGLDRKTSLQEAIVNKFYE